ncbi:MAG: class I SAM-dependent methyltransferase, partial [Phycisphaerae bacterium]
MGPAIAAGAIESDVAAYYSAKLRAHGPTARGVDWNGEASQELRFAQLLRIVDESAATQAATERATLLDFGCGYGALFDTLRQGDMRLRYVGYDISETMIDAARRRFADAAGCAFTSSLAGLAPADYTVASGVFNVRLSHDNANWSAYVEQTIAQFAALSRRGFAFNVLTSYADEDRKRPDLYYADPCFWFDHCKRRYSRRVA